MRAAIIALVVVAVLLGGARLFTGLVYGADEPVSYLVLKPSPDLVIERIETPTRPARAGRVLAQDELSLPHAGAYIALMRAAPAAAAACLALAAILVALGRRRRPAA